MNNMPAPENKSLLRPAALSLLAACLLTLPTSNATAESSREHPQNIDKEHCRPLPPEHPRPGRRVPGIDPACGRDGETGTFRPIPRPAAADFSPAQALPDRWRIVDSLGYQQRWYDPYNRNILKGDTPLYDDWFFSLTAISDSVFEYRDVPTPVGIQSSGSSAELDLLGGRRQTQLLQNLALELIYLKGDTVFRPPDYEFRLTPVFNYNDTDVKEILTVDVNPNDGDSRYQDFVGLQAAFVDVHLRNVSEHYDFDSLRVGIQPFTADFRGFLFQENQLGVRLFGTRNNNIFQYNLAWFRRLEKDTNSGLNDLGESPRNDDVFVANLYWQDLLALGHTSQFTLLYNRNREDAFFFDHNGLIQRPASLGVERPRQYDVLYLGYNSDGHFGRLNISSASYYAIGRQDSAPFTGRNSDISAFFAALELSIDQSWIRWRASLLYGSGDDDPFDDRETGFDAVVENPLFAGADTSYWIRQAVPLIGGGKVALSSRNGVLNSLRASREHGQSNFTNPGVVLAGVGADFDLLPELRLSLNANQLWFETTEVLEVARQQADIDKDIGQDLSLALIYRPLMSQNIVMRLSYAELLPGEGYKNLFGDERQRSVLLNVILTY